MNNSNHGEYKSEVINSLPVGRIGMHTNSSDAFFKMDEELNDLLPKSKYVMDFNSDVDLSNIDFDSIHLDDDENLDESLKNFTVGSPATVQQTKDSRGVSIEKSQHRLDIASSIPIDISLPKSHASYHVDGEDDLISINKLETKLRGANSDEIAEAFSLREQTLFRNMQLLSLSVQPDDCPERLFGIREDSPHDNGISRVGPRTYASGAIEITQQHHQLQNSPASVHTPKQPARIMRPSQSRKGDRLPTAPQM